MTNSIQIKKISIPIASELLEFNDILNKFKKTYNHKIPEELKELVFGFDKKIKNDCEEYKVLKNNIIQQLYDLIEKKQWYKVTLHGQWCKTFYFFPYILNAYSNGVFCGMYVPIDDIRNCGIIDKSFHINDFTNYDSDWIVVSESEVINYVKDNIHNVIDYRKSRLD